ncbi:M48 family metalloprotease [Pseudomonas sp. Gutcm_11s]|uniref:M48 family metalloprotease n=1 Tax=Pseudomonas sp. Gutcm_11s TaxID=3026088 RepID=UPI0023612E82|nr:M48 family metalloprotease [Pseudomonas sp. Gutcm_11s]MDD0842188.1 M48 family metalloprotease [Pseudomonas sp. Gutcm_11s]
MHKIFCRSALLVAICAALPACENLQALEGVQIQGVDLTPLASAGRSLSDMGEKTQDEELVIGASTAELLLKQAPLLDNAAVQSYVNEVGRWVALNSERPDLPWRFGVLDSRVVGAYAAPGGYVFVTSGMLAQMNSEAELAGVLAHEVAHVVQKHHLDAIKQKAGAGLLASVSRFALQASQANSGSVSSSDPAATQKFDQLVTNLYTRGLDRGDEYEADQMGAVIAARAGYDPYGLANVLQDLGTMKQDDATLVTFLKVHPNINDRLTRLEPTYQYLDKAAAGGSQQTLEQRYQKALSAK